MEEKTPKNETDTAQDLEKKFKAPQYLIDAKKSAIADCRMLYCGVKKPVTQSLMCFGWECGDGWNREIADLSYRLEAMNLLLYPKYRTRIEAVQIKEKFGYFTGYFTVVTDPPTIMGLPSRLFSALHGFLTHKINYGYERVTDAPSSYTEDWEEISKKDFDGKVAPSYVSNEFGWKFEERDGKYYRNQCIYHPERWHMRPTKHLFFHWLKEFAWKLAYASNRLFRCNPTREQSVMSDFMSLYMEKCISDTEKKCHDTCEYCGNHIGNRYYGRCTTLGWIQYICEDCAKKRNLEYVNQKGELCNPDGSVKMTKEEFERYQQERYRVSGVESDEDCNEEEGLDD